MTENRKIPELELDRAFANELVASSQFSAWVLNHTKFKDRSSHAILLNEEQALAKPNKKPENWWRHWWCRLDDGSESETDIFVVFGFPDSRERIALHIEDKPPHGKFTANQPLHYHRRAEFMARSPKYMDYSDYATILLAPESFIEKYTSDANLFDHRISYEVVSEFIPLFGQSLSKA